MGPNSQEQIPRESIEASSAHPLDWPGIPGRSAEHEARPGGLPWRRDDEPSEPAVTRAQRELEHALQVR